ncbi:MAG: hypothetical protein ACLSVD_09160 [Eggerthellaceae bacterium]
MFIGLVKPQFEPPDDGARRGARRAVRRRTVDRCAALADAGFDATGVVGASQGQCGYLCAPCSKGLDDGGRVKGVHERSADTVVHLRGFWRVSWCLVDYWCIAIVGIPVGTQCFKMASRSSRSARSWRARVGHPQRAVVRVRRRVPGAQALLNGVLLCITVIGIPFGLQCFAGEACPAAPCRGEK